MFLKQTSHKCSKDMNRLLLYINQVCSVRTTSVFQRRKKAEQYEGEYEWSEFSFLVEHLLYRVCCPHKAAESTESHPCISTWMSAHSEAVLAVCPHKHSSPLGGGQIGFLCLRSRHVTHTETFLFIYILQLWQCVRSQYFFVFYLSFFHSPSMSFSRRGGRMERWIEGELPQERDKAIFPSP